MKRFHRVTIKSLPVTVPLYKDEAATEELAQKIDSRLHEIESQSAHPDIISAAFRVAFEYARDHDQLKELWESDNRELVRALERLTSLWKDILEAYRQV